MAQMCASFGQGNQGLQVGHNHGSINTQIHLPPGKVTVALCESRSPADIVRTS
jgi:hypothetical protein